MHGFDRNYTWKFSCRGVYPINNFRVFQNIESILLIYLKTNLKYFLFLFFQITHFIYPENTVNREA
jgi:hypothetical protein